MLYLLLLLLSFSSFILRVTADISLQDHLSVLTHHNRLRRSHNTPALRWDFSLAQQASEFTDVCKFKQNNRAELSKINALDNVAQGYNNWNQTILAWYNGHKYYDYKNPGYTKDAGTFITMIWKNTKQIGCSLKTCSSGKLYHCIYSPSIPINLVLNEAEYKSNVLRLKEQ